MLGSYFGSNFGGLLVEPGGSVLLDDEARVFRRLHARLAARLCGFRKVPFRLIEGKLVSCHDFEQRARRAECSIQTDCIKLATQNPAQPGTAGSSTRFRPEGARQCITVRFVRIRCGR